MLRELRIRNFAIIDDLHLQFGAGLNVITGETGAGKSILLRALGLLCGERAHADLVRSETSEAIIEGVFDLPGAPAALASLGLDPDDDGLIVRRHIGAGGKGRVYVNGNAATASMLRDLAAHLVNIYGQHDQALLLRPGNHLDYLDDYGDHRDERAAMQRAFIDLRAAQKHLLELDERIRHLAERRDLLEFQLNELRSLTPAVGEESELRAARERLRHAERIGRVCSEAESALYAANDAMVTRLARLRDEVEGLAEAVPDLKSPAELIEQGRLHLEEAALQMRTIASHSTADPDRLEQVEERLAMLARSSKKFAVPSDDLADVLTRLEAELRELEGHDENRSRAVDVLAERLATARRCAAALSAKRDESARKLESAMAKELADLGMDGGVFEVARETSAMSDVEDLGLTGADRIEFFLSANRGEPAQPLARVASGGELSRILLALKSLTAASAETPVLIFDEVDAGIGGAVAEAVAIKLRSLADTRQILCITHLAQIAARADHHYAVHKRQRDGRTISETRALAGEERVVELSRMLGGSASAEATRYARELIAQGSVTVRQRPGA